MLPRKQAMLRRRGAAASLGDSSKLVECFGGGSLGVSEVVGRRCQWVVAMSSLNASVGVR